MDFYTTGHVIAYINQFGFWAPVAAIVLFVIQAMVSIIPSLKLAITQIGQVNSIFGSNHFSFSFQVGKILLNRQSRPFNHFIRVAAEAILILRECVEYNAPRCQDTFSGFLS